MCVFWRPLNITGALNYELAWKFGFAKLVTLKHRLNQCFYMMRCRGLMQFLKFKCRISNVLGCISALSHQIRNNTCTVGDQGIEELVDVPCGRAKESLGFAGALGLDIS